MKFDFVQRLKIGWVGDCDKQTYAATNEGQCIVAFDQGVVNQILRYRIEIQRRQIDQWHPEFFGCGRRDQARLRQSVLDKIGDERRALLAGFVAGFDGGVGVENTLFYEASRQATERNRFRCHYGTQILVFVGTTLPSRRS